MGTSGPQKIDSDGDGDEFKVRSVRLSKEPGGMVKTRSDQTLLALASKEENKSERPLHMAILSGVFAAVIISPARYKVANL